MCLLDSLRKYDNYRSKFNVIKIGDMEKLEPRGFFFRVEI